MSDNRKYVGGSTYRLSGAGAIVGATTITINNFQDADGNDLSMSDFGTKGYGTLQPNVAGFQEFITWTGVTNNGDGTWTLTGVSSQLAKTPYTETSGLLISHPGASSFIVSDPPGFWDGFTNKYDDENIDGIWDYSQVPSTQADPVSGNDIARRSWVLSVVNGGAVSQNSIILTGTAGETITKDQLVYLKASDGRWWKADADTANNVDNVQLGIAQGSGTAGVTISGGVLVRGFATLTLTTVTANAVVYASNTAGGLSATPGTTVRIVGYAISTTTLYFNPDYAYIPTAIQQGNFPSTGEKQAMAGGGNFGTPSTTNKFITQDYNASATGLSVVRVYAYTSVGASDSQFDITNPSGTTFRYTWDGTGTNPNINTSTFPTGAKVSIFIPTTTGVNNGNFTVTGSGANYFEVTNASGNVESNETIGAGYIKVFIATNWSKPSGLKYVIAEVVGGGGGGGGCTTTNNGTAGGGGGGYARKLIAASALGATETPTPGRGGKAGVGTGGTGGTGETSSFGSLVQATGGTGGADGSLSNGGTGGVGSLGDVNIAGQGGQPARQVSAGAAMSGSGGSSALGGGAPGKIASGTDVIGTVGGLYGGGGAGAAVGSGADTNGGAGADGVVIITEFYS